MQTAYDGVKIFLLVGRIDSRSIIFYFVNLLLIILKNSQVINSDNEQQQSRDFLWGEGDREGVARSIVFFIYQFFIKRILRGKT